MSDSGSSLVDALSRLPVYRGFTWRAAGFELTAPFSSDAPIPTTRDLRVATENFRAVGVHLILSTGGRDIGPFSAHPSDQEVVLLPGARLVPATSFHEVAGLRIQVVIEQPRSEEPIPDVPTDAEIGEIILAAQAKDDVAVFSPGRYGA
ncbi:MAG TPA: hypothetical protein VEX42_03965 [Microbacterium sp.]|nr:hypothetical protein [Microbacterium sp.]